MRTITSTRRRTRLVNDLAGLPEEDIEKIMGGNMMQLLKVSGPVLA